MPHTAKLLIRPRGSTADRVITLAAGSGPLRVGRSALCEIRLFDPTIAPLECRIVHEPEQGWTLIPERTNSLVKSRGQRIDRPLPLQFDDSFQVGDETLTLRSEADADALATTIEVEVEPESPRVAQRPDWASRTMTARDDRIAQSRDETRKWESRWRAVGERLRENGGGVGGVGRIPESPTVPLSERPAPTIARPSTRATKVPPTPRPIARPLPTAERLIARAAEPPTALRPSTVAYPGRLPKETETREPAAPVVRPQPPLSKAVAEPKPKISRSQTEPILDVETETAVADLVVDEVIDPAPCTVAVRVVEAVDDDHELLEDREAEALPKRRLGFTRRISRSTRKPKPTVIEPVVDAPLFDVAPASTSPTVEAAPSPSPTTAEPSFAWAFEPPIRSATASTASSLDANETIPHPETSRRSEPISNITPRDRDWPSVNDILAARPSRREATRTPTRRSRKPAILPEPTVASEPDQWSMPVWLGWFPTTAASLFIVGSVVGLNWFWTVDNYHAGMVARRLDLKSGVVRPLPEGVEPGPSQWWRTTSTHLLTWSQYFDRDDNDPARLAESRALLKQASMVSPLSPTVRHAAAIAASEPGPNADPDPFALAKVVGQSHDIVTMGRAGGQLLKAGKPDAALQAYKVALEMASKTGVDQPISPILDGAQVRRYSLPTEDLLAPLIRDMAGQSAWSFDDWKKVLPKRSIAPVVAARVLQELRHKDADAALELAMESAVSETLIHDSNLAQNTATAILLAAEAETLVLKDKLREALECYHSAIERMPNDRIVRSWWLNIAGIAQRLNQDDDRKRALELAKCDDPKDEITTNAIEWQKEAGDLLKRVANRNKNDPETKAASNAISEN